MSPRVELVIDKNCPNVQTARDQLEHALVSIGLSGEWGEWDRDHPDSPAHVRKFGSPTILVDGRDVAGDGTEAEANCCRVYQTNDGIRGVPSVEMIVAALTAT